MRIGLPTRYREVVLTSCHQRGGDRQRLNGSDCVQKRSRYYFGKGTAILFSMSEQTYEPVQPPTREDDLRGDLPGDLLDPYERLVAIEVLGKQVEVPEKNRLLRCFQFLSLKTISYGDFCWNGDCTNCQIWYHTDGQSQDNDKPGLACRMEVIEGMTITSMSQCIKLEGITK